MIKSGGSPALLLHGEGVLRAKGQGGGGSSAMQKTKLNYRFHNLNSVTAIAGCMLKILINANSEKVEKVIWDAAD